MAEGIIPAALWEGVTLEEYLTFRLYGLEYVSLILEQMSYEREKKILDGTIPMDENLPYGVVQQIQVHESNMDSSFIVSFL